MPHFLNQTGLSLRDRLKQHVGFPLAVRAEGSVSEPGGLQHVGKQFIKVNGIYYVPSCLEEIVILGLTPEAIGADAELRTESRGTFRTKLLRTGEDFVEVLVETGSNSRPDWLVIPLNKIISIERAG